MSTDQPEPETSAVDPTDALRAPQSLQPSSCAVTHGDETGSDPFPFPGTDASEDAAATQSGNPVLTRSHPFPLGEGTGERVKTAFGSVSADPFPTRGNGRERGNGTPENSFPLPPRSIPLPFTINRPAHPRTSTALIRSTAQPSSSWTPQDLSNIVAGLVARTLDRPRPTVGLLADGTFCLYAAAVNGVAGESGSGKSWFALQCAAGELAAGHNVVYIDLEDSPIGIVARLLDMGVPADVIADPSRFVYLHPDEAFRDDVRAGFWLLLDIMQPSLVVIDSTGESMALEGTDPNSDAEVANWFKGFAVPTAARGPAVLLLDHLPKADNAASFPIGSQRKKAAISGAQFTQTVAKGMSFAKGRSGAARLTCSKDRHGNFTNGEVVMELIVHPEPLRGESGVAVTLRPSAVEEWAPTRHMEEVSLFLESAGSPKSTAAIKSGVKGKSETIVTALRVLVESGFIVASTGARNGTDYESVKPYRIGDPYTVPDDIAPGGGAGCGHAWHDGTCKADWCHTGHYGSCNERVEEGYVLDADGEIISEPAEVVANRERVMQEVLARNAASLPVAADGSTPSPWNT